MSVNELHLGAAEALDELVYTGAGVAIALRRIARIHMGMSHHGDGFVDVIENHHAIVEGEAQVGELTIVCWRMGQAFHITDRIVAGIADGAAAKPRQAGNVRRMISLQALFKHPEWVGAVKFLRALFIEVRLDPNVAIVSPETQKRSRAKETVAANPFAADDAFEEKGPIAFLNLAKRGDRRERVADELAIDGNDAARGRDP